MKAWADGCDIKYFYKIQNFLQNRIAEYIVCADTHCKLVNKNTYLHITGYCVLFKNFVINYFRASNPKNEDRFSAG